MNTVLSHPTSTMTIKRSHGLGNLLLPVLDAIEKESVAINIVIQ
jgi:hypothetical protein